MAVRQFDVFDNPATDARSYAPYVIVLSSHLLHDLQDIVVAPLVNDAHHRLSGLEVEVDVNGTKLTLVVGEMSTLRARDLRRRAGSLLELEFDIRRALDRLFTGF